MAWKRVSAGTSVRERSGPSLPDSTEGASERRFYSRGCRYASALARCELDGDRSKVAPGNWMNEHKLRSPPPATQKRHIALQPPRGAARPGYLDIQLVEVSVKLLNYLGRLTPKTTRWTWPIHQADRRCETVMKTLIHAEMLCATEWRSLASSALANGSAIPSLVIT